MPLDTRIVPTGDEVRIKRAKLGCGIATAHHEAAKDLALNLVEILSLGFYGEGDPPNRDTKDLTDDERWQLIASVLEYLVKRT